MSAMHFCPMLFQVTIVVVYFFLIKYANIIKNLTIASFLIISFETMIFISTDYSNRSIHYNLVCEWIKERGSDFISDLSRNMIRIDL